MASELLNNFVKSLKSNVDQCPNEAMTRQLLVLPLLKAVGFEDVDIRLEYEADTRKRGSTRKVDIMLVQNTSKHAAIEIKSCKRQLLPDDVNQLRGYFQPCGARVGILTNGLQWKLYSDIDKQNVMDNEPFYQLDFTDASTFNLDLVECVLKISIDRNARKIAKQIRDISLLYRNKIKPAIDHGFSVEDALVSSRFPSFELAVPQVEMSAQDTLTDVKTIVVNAADVKNQRVPTPLPESTRERFWKQLLPVLYKQYPGVYDTHKGSHDAYLTTSKGTNGFEIDIIITGDGTSRLQLIVKSAKRAAPLYNRLKLSMDNINASFGHIMEWTPNETGNSQHIKWPIMYDVGDEKTWPIVIDFIATNVGKFINLAKNADRY
jgi:hypothetical protein